MSGRIKGPSDSHALWLTSLGLSAGTKGAGGVETDSYIRLSGRGKEESVTINAPQQPKPVDPKKKSKQASTVYLEEHLAKSLRSIHPKTGAKIILDETFLKIPLDKWVFLIFTSGLDAVTFAFGSSDNARVRGDIKISGGLREITVQGLSGDERRVFKGRTLKGSHGNQSVFWESGSRLLARYVSEEILKTQLRSWLNPEFAGFETVLSRLKTQASSHEPYDASAIIRTFVKGAVLQVLPDWLKETDWPIMKPLKDAYISGDVKRQKELLAVFNYHFDQYMRAHFTPVRAKKMNSAADVLGDLVKTLHDTTVQFIPDAWVKRDSLLQAHIWKDYTPLKVVEGFNALLYLLTRTYYELFNDCCHIHPLGIERYNNMSDPTGKTPDELRANRLQMAYEMADIAIKYIQKPEGIKTQLTDIVDIGIRKYKNALATADRFVPRESAYWRAIKEALYQAIQKPDPEYSNFYLVVIHQLAQLLLKEGAHKKSILKLVLDDSLPESYREYNKEKIQIYLEEFLSKKEEGFIKKALVNPQDLMEEFESTLESKFSLLMVLALPADEKTARIWDATIDINDLDENLSNDRRLFQLWFQANDLDLQGEYYQSISIYDLIRGELLFRKDFDKVGIVTLKVAECLKKNNDYNQARETIMTELRVLFPHLTTHTRRLLLEGSSFFLKDMKYYDEVITVLNDLMGELERDAAHNAAGIIKTMIRKAQLFHTKGELKTAANAYRKAMDHPGTDLKTKAETYWLIADLYERAEEHKPGELKRAALAYFETARLQRQNGDYDVFIDACDQGIHLWHQAHANLSPKDLAAKWDAPEIDIVIDSLFKTARFLKQGSAFHTNAEKRTPQMQRFDRALSVVDKISEYRNALVKEHHEEWDVLRASRNIWDKAKQIAGDNTINDFTVVLQLVGQKLGISREEMVDRWYQHGNFRETNYTIVSSYLDTYFNSHGILTPKFWPETKEVLQQLQLSEDQIALFDAGKEGEAIEARIEAWQQTVELEPEDPQIPEDPFFDSQVIFLPAQTASMPISSLGGIPVTGFIK